MSARARILERHHRALSDISVRSHNMAVDGEWGTEHPEIDLLAEAEALTDAVLADLGVAKLEEDKASFADLVNKVGAIADKVIAENAELKAELAECQAAMRAVVAFYQAGGADQ